MKCICGSLLEVFYLDSAGAGFMQPLRERSAENWKRLYQCESCGVYWAVDEWDKYAHQVASRVSSPTEWDTASDQQRKKLLLQARGGLTSEKCIWAGCAALRVKGVAFCIDHLYATGARK
jgi:hypothetical protein